MLDTNNDDHDDGNEIVPETGSTQIIYHYHETYANEIVERTNQVTLSTPLTDIQALIFPLSITQ